MKKRRKTKIISTTTRNEPPRQNNVTRKSGDEIQDYLLPMKPNIENLERKYPKERNSGSDL